MSEQRYFLGKSFFILLLGINSFVFSTRLLDYYLTSRFLTASFLILVFCVCLFVAATKKKRSLGWLDMAIVFFVFWNGLSILWADHFAEAVFTFQRWLLFLIAYFLTKIFLQDFSKNQHSFFGKLSSILGLVIGLIAGYQIIEIGMKYGFSNDALYRVNVLFGHKSLIAAFLALLIPMQLMRRKGDKISVAVVGIILFEFILILILQSRTVYLSLFAFGLIGLRYIYLHRKKILSKHAKLRWSIGGGAVFILFSGLMLLNPSIRQRVNPVSYLDSATGKERTFVWSKTLHLVEENPWLGVGAGNWKILFPSHGIEGSWRLHEKNVVFTRAHNDFLETFAELGMPGGFAYLICFLGPLLLLSRLRSKNSFQKLLIQAGLVGFIIVSILDFPKERIEFLILLSIYLAMAAELTRGKTWVEFASGYLITKIILIVGIVTMSFNLYTGFYRYRGEMNMVDLFKARQQKKWDQMVSFADAAYNPWYHHDPAAVPVHHYKGIALYNLDKLSDAQAAFQTAYSHNPYNFHVINNLATSYLHQKNYEKAIELFREALDINWKFADGRYNLAYCYVALGKFDLARQEIKKLPKETQKRGEYIQLISQMIETVNNRN